MAGQAATPIEFGDAEVGTADPDRQLGLYEGAAPRHRVLAPRPVARLCAGCRAKEARYGFRTGDSVERPSTLCFECFRMEIDFRQRVAVQLARGWNAEQPRLPLADTLKALDLRRRRAQIAARHECDRVAARGANHEAHTTTNHGRPTHDEQRSA